MLRKAIKKGNEMKKIKATIFWGAVIILLLGIGVTVAHFKFGFLKKDETTEFVIQKIESQAKLKVTKTTSKEVKKVDLEPELVKEWNELGKGLVSIFSGRNMTIKAVVETDFALDLSKISSEAIKVKNNVFTVTEPLIVEVDSQIDYSKTEIEKDSNGAFDKVVDIFTNRKDANQFMQDNLKSVDVTASENVSMDDTVKQKVVKDTNKALGEFLSKATEKPVKVALTEKDFTFVNVDK